MATDALLAVQAAATKTATFHSTGLNLPGGTPRRGYFVRVLYSAAATTSGTASLQFDVDVSDDNSTFYTKTSGAAALLSLTSTAQAGEIFLPIETSKPYIRLTGTFTDTGSEVGMTVRVQGDLVLGRPA